MDSIKPTPPPTRKNKLARTIQKVIHLKIASRTLSNNYSCLLIPNDKCINGDPKSETHQHIDGNDEAKYKSKAAMEAFIAKLFATVSAVKAAYAELQMAQFPYNGDLIQCADQAVVTELKTLSQLKLSYLKKQIDPSPPHVTILLSEIQEQQGLMKMYEITMKKMENEIDSKDSEISLLQKGLHESVLENKSLERKLNSSGCFSVLDNVKLSDANPKDFVTVLHYAVRSIRNFVKLLVREMESANWDINAATKTIQPDVIFSNDKHRCFAFESFVCFEMFNGFDTPNFSLPNESSPSSHMDEFKNLKSISWIHILRQNQNKDSTFAKFARAKYLRLVHPKMEASFCGNLNQRKMVSAWEWPDTTLFGAFAEMARRVWLLHSLAFCFSKEVSVFQVMKNCRFSEVYMESVADDVFLAADGDFRVAFTVVPGFKIGKTVIQSQVYLSPASC